MNRMPSNVIRLWELDNYRAPARLVGALELEADGMGSFVELSPNFIEHEPIDADPITIYPPHEVDSFTVKLIGDVAIRFDFDISRTYALEVWAKIMSDPHDCDTDERWAYLVIPAMSRPVTLSTMLVEVPVAADNADTGAAPVEFVMREVDEMMTRDDDGAPVSLEGPFQAAYEDCYPVVCFRTDRAGHRWDEGPAPTAYTNEGTPAYLPGPLEPSSMYLQMVTNMSPADALEYPKATGDA